MKTGLLLAFCVGCLAGAYLISVTDMDRIWEKYNLPTLFDPIVPISEEEFEREFMDFVSKYRRSYDNSNEFNYRYEVSLKSLLQSCKMFPLL